MKNSNEALENYIYQKMRGRKPWYLIKLGIQRMIYNPTYILGVFALTILVVAIWHNKYVFQIDVLTGSVAVVYGIFIEGAIVLMLFMLMLLYITQLGKLLAQKYESMPVVEFSTKELRPGHPILTSYKRDRITKVEELVYFTLIDIKIWDIHKDAIAKKLKSRCVQDLEYGGKHKDNSNYIIMYIKKGCVLKERGEVFDDEL